MLSKTAYGAMSSCGAVETARKQKEKEGPLTIWNKHLRHRQTCLNPLFFPFLSHTHTVRTHINRAHTCIHVPRGPRNPPVFISSRPHLTCLLAILSFPLQRTVSVKCSWVCWLQEEHFCPLNWRHPGSSLTSATTYYRGQCLIYSFVFFHFME